MLLCECMIVTVEGLQSTLILISFNLLTHHSLTYLASLIFWVSTWLLQLSYEF